MMQFVAGGYFADFDRAPVGGNEIAAVDELSMFSSCSAFQTGCRGKIFPGA
jgi:hypothetical protein